ncbi:hypothetical protein L7F22_063487 [Adiantum nelumboides]|nr:hypothetical protein [Adiantum nelumboides]
MLTVNSLHHLLHRSVILHIFYLPTMLSSNLPIGITELLEESPSKKLLDAIIQEGCDANCFSYAINMVKPNVDSCLMIENAKEYMLEEWQEFEGCLQKGSLVYDGKEFVHLRDFTLDPVIKSKITRKFRKLKDNYLHFLPSNICLKHQKVGCNLVRKPIAFLFYLNLLIDSQPKKSQSASEGNPPFPFESVSTIKNLDKAEELKEEPIDFVLEEKKSANLDVAFFRAQTVVDEPIEVLSIS